MTHRSWSVLAGLALALLAEPARAQPDSPSRPTTRPPAIVAPAHQTRGTARDLYSPRARRLVRTYLQLQMLELREAELDRVQAIIQGKLGVDALFSPQPARAAGRAVR